MTIIMNSLSTLAFILINLGCFSSLVGLLIKDEVKMRLAFMIGALLFLVGYLDSSPTLEIYGTSWAALFAIINLVLFVKLNMANSTAKFTQREKFLYSAFRGMEPDEFKELLAITHWHEAAEHVKLTSENQVCPNLYYVLQGKIEVSKEENMFTLNSNTFIGEVGYFLRSGASATTIVSKGALYVAWKAKDLRELEANVPGFRATIYELLNKDMALKVAASLR